MPTEAEVEAGARVMAELPSIDAPKLPAACWMGSVRSILEAVEAVRDPKLSLPDSWYCDRCQVEVHRFRCPHCGKSPDESRNNTMTARPEIETAMRENRDMSPRERLSFGLDEMALLVRAWLKYTKDMRDKEGLDCGEYADVHFPFNPSYPMFEIWSKTMEDAAQELRNCAPVDPFQHQAS